MSEVTDEQIREFVQLQATIEAMLRTQAGLEQQRAIAIDLAQEMPMGHSFPKFGRTRNYTD